MRIGLYGIGGLYNFGCEAIVRGACIWLRQQYPGCKILYFSLFSEYDKKAVTDLDIEIVPVKRSKSFLLRGINKVLRECCSEKQIPLIQYKEILDRVDMILSIGGDIYTIPRVLLGQKRYPYCNQLVDFCDRAIDNRKHVIVYGASVGPFGSYGKALRYYTRNLRKYDKIYCREAQTYAYLQSLGLDNIECMSDPAFLVRLPEETPRQRKYIGINFSPLSFREVYGGDPGSKVESAAGIVDAIYEQFRTDILLLPHVIAPDSRDNDLLFLQKVYAQTKAQTRKHITFADTSGGFLGIKRQIRDCKMVIAARMHCAINAVCEGVPTIFLSYSQKSIGMCKYVYGDARWMVKLNDINENLVSKARELLDNCDSVNQFLLRRNKEILEHTVSNQCVEKPGMRT